MRLALITEGTKYAEQIMLGLSLRDIVLDTLILVHEFRPSFQSRWSLTIRHLSLGGGIARLLLRKIANTFDKQPPESQIIWQGLCREICDGGVRNSSLMLDTLRAAQPDFLILGGVGILSAAALQIPIKGTINVHPGLLPWVRGVGVVARSLERQVAVGVTAHCVDAGIDTGQIIRRELVSISNVETLGSAIRKTAKRSVDVMVDVVSALHEGNGLRVMNQTLRYPYCKWPSPAEEAAVDKQVQEGLARALYVRWREFYGSDRLPFDDSRCPHIAISPLAPSQGESYDTH